MAVCGAAILVYGCMVSGTSVSLACDFGRKGAVSNSQNFVTICLIMASWNCLMAVMKQSVADTAGSGI